MAVFEKQHHHVGRRLERGDGVKPAHVGPDDGFWDNGLSFAIPSSPNILLMLWGKGALDWIRVARWHALFLQFPG